jgi:hypothetical protein
MAQPSAKDPTALQTQVPEAPAVGEEKRSGPELSADADLARIAEALSRLPSSPPGADRSNKSRK